MRAVQRQPISLLDSWPAPDTDAVRQALREELRRFDRKVVVLDDDPTGVQTVHDISVYTDWTEETFRAGLESNDRLFFVLTNSRSFSAGETTRVHREIAEHLAAASQKTGVPFVLISRSDSTLRGHFPLETETLRTELEALLPERYDGEILLPFFLEGGRYTIDNVHYVREGDTLVPAGETEFARDTTFAYRASDLTEWCQEKTGGAYPAEQVVSISLDELRRRDYDAVCEKLMGVSGFNKVVVNAVCYDDVAVFVTAYLRAAARGKVFMFRGSAAVVKVLGTVSDQPLLRRESVESLLRAFAEHLQTQKETERMIFRLAYRAKDDPTPLVGSPVLFDSGYFPALRTLPEGKGGSFLLRQYPEQVHCFYTAHHEELWDADTPEALQKLEAML